jgi:hypothetical protein
MVQPFYPPVALSNTLTNAELIGSHGGTRWCSFCRMRYIALDFLVRGVAYAADGYHVALPYPISTPRHRGTTPKTRYRGRNFMRGRFNSVRFRAYLRSGRWLEIDTCACDAHPIRRSYGSVHYLGILDQ